MKTFCERTFVMFLHFAETCLHVVGIRRVIGIAAQNLEVNK